MQEFLYILYLFVTLIEIAQLQPMFQSQLSFFLTNDPKSTSMMHN